MNDTTSRLATALADRYVIERELGAGGMATVYLAEDRPVPYTTQLAALVRAVQGNTEGALELLEQLDMRPSTPT